MSSAKDPVRSWRNCTSSGAEVLSLVPSHHNHAIGEKIGIRLDADHVIAFKQHHA